MSQKNLILGCAVTGAKFTRENHRPTGDVMLDQICSGAAIRTSPLGLVAEAESLYGMGCRYYHYHARDRRTGEQSTSNEIYQEVSRWVQRRCPEMLISFGASRNGRDVRRSIQKFGEWERVSQCSLPLHLGGAHFVTLQAAAELQLICEIEAIYGGLTIDQIDSDEFRELIHGHRPSSRGSDLQVETYSTSNGDNYGKTSPLIQFEVYKNAIHARRQLGLQHEVEWVQLLRSHAMTRYAIEHTDMRLGDSGQLNITILFGFSPRLPFPDTYLEFKEVVNRAKSLEYDLSEQGVKKRHVTITVGAAVIPQQAAENFKPLDVGVRRGELACALRRLATFAAQPDSKVDVLRVGMEDTPYRVTDGCVLRPTDNCQLAEIAIDELEANDAGVMVDNDAIFERAGMREATDSLIRRQRSRPLGDSPGIVLWS